MTGVPSLMVHSIGSLIVDVICCLVSLAHALSPAVIAGALEPRRSLPHLSMPLTKGPPSSSFCFRVHTKLSVCLVGFLLQRARRVVILEEKVRGHFGSIVTVRVGVEGEKAERAHTTYRAPV
jgi:hypothetical protein